MEQEVLVKVEGLSKKFCKSLKKSLRYGVQDLVGSVLGKQPTDTLRKDEFWALQDINFELRRGECLGLIGHNGAGKSTLLKILNGLINPDHGKVTLRGRVGALIELGAGFNPILSGRENIYNNGAVLGFTKEEIDNKVEKIIDFAELQEFIDMPVQNYSSGMKVRLGFAVAAQMEPDVLIIDEVLAVGDASFRAKSFNRMTDLSKKCAIIFVSHSMPLMGRICNRGLILHKGEVNLKGPITTTIHKYLIDQNIKHANVVGESKLDHFNIRLDRDKLQYLDDLNFHLEFAIPAVYKKVVVHYSIIDQELKTIYQAFSIEKNIVLYNEDKIMKLNVCVKNIDLTNGKYLINIGFIENDFYGKNICRFDSVADFTVNGSKYNSFASIVKDTLWKQN